MKAGTPPLIRLRGITRVYGSGQALVQALRGVDLDIADGEFVEAWLDGVYGGRFAFPVNTGNQQIDPVQRVYMIPVIIGDHANLGTRIALVDQISNGFRFVDPKIARIGDMAHEIMLLKRLHIHQRETADAAHRKTQRYEAPTRA